MKLIWETMFWCNACGKDILGRLYSEELDTTPPEDEKKKALEWLQHTIKLKIILRAGNVVKILDRVKSVLSFGLIMRCRMSVRTVVKNHIDPPPSQVKGNRRENSDQPAPVPNRPWWWR